MNGYFLIFGTMPVSARMTNADPIGCIMAGEWTSDFNRRRIEVKRARRKGRAGYGGSPLSTRPAGRRAVCPGGAR